MSPDTRSCVEGLDWLLLCGFGFFLKSFDRVCFSHHYPAFQPLFLEGEVGGKRSGREEGGGLSCGRPTAPDSFHTKLKNGPLFDVLSCWRPSKGRYEEGPGF